MYMLYVWWWWGGRRNFNERKQIKQTINSPTRFQLLWQKVMERGLLQDTPRHRGGKAQGEVRKHEEIQFCRDYIKENGRSHRPKISTKSPKNPHRKPKWVKMLPKRESMATLLLTAPGLTCPWGLYSFQQCSQVASPFYLFNSNF